jgi:two-component system response regulator PilR (NtrC family)
MSDRVLVVDDEVDLVASYERLLRRQGYRMIAAGSRHEGLVIIGREPLALVISDLRLPDGDGLDIVRAARRPPTPIPVVVVTGFASEASRAAALAVGASAYLTKPFAASEFSALIDEAVRGGPR